MNDKITYHTTTPRAKNIRKRNENGVLVPEEQLRDRHREAISYKQILKQISNGNMSKEQMVQAAHNCLDRNRKWYERGNQ